MSCINVNVSTNVNIELTDFEKETLVRAYKILKKLDNDLYMEDAEDTDEAFKVMQAMEGLQQFLNHTGINYTEDTE